ncbi:ribbon-helix-helix domain-containing protein [Neorhizobium sp. DAR64861/K0K2]|jgi:Arc/MetJ-type ribon-helix-helix transcriptional regulator|uniref:ribbon-helix-helix domain-containing protein n=1 Tax=unclassified Neorhizobium TaxID=2629175 RepID=UPI003D2A895E
MRHNRSFTVMLPDDLADLVDKKVASGEFSDESAVLTEGLRQLAGRDSETEDWIRREVVPTIEAHDPSRVIPMQDVRRRIEAHMDLRDQSAHDL